MNHHPTCEDIVLPPSNDIADKDRSQQQAQADLEAARELISQYDATLKQVVDDLELAYDTIAKHEESLANQTEKLESTERELLDALEELQLTQSELNKVKEELRRTKTDLNRANNGVVLEQKQTTLEPECLAPKQAFELNQVSLAKPGPNLDLSKAVC